MTDCSPAEIIRRITRSINAGTYHLETRVDSAGHVEIRLRTWTKTDLPEPPFACLILSASERHAIVTLMQWDDEGGMAYGLDSYHFWDKGQPLPAKDDEEETE